MGEFRMPSLGADMDEGTVTRWLVHPGDTVHRGDIVAVIDTDKADVDVEIFEDGVIEEILVPEGTKVTVGTPLARVGAATGETATPAPAAPPAPRPRSPSPLVRRHAAELGVDLATVEGTGPGGLVTRADVDRAAGVRHEAPPPAPSGATPPVPAGATEAGRRVSPRARRRARELGVDAAAVTGTGPGGAVTGADVEAAGEAPAAARPPTPRREPSSKPSAGKAASMRAAIARTMARSKREIPHYYLATDIDFSRARAFLDERNAARPVTERVLPAALLLKATALAVRETPALNGFWLDDELHPSDAVHLGVAISLRSGGLVAPAIHDADTLSVDELMAALQDLVQRARAYSLRASEMSDPTITVTNLGDQGVQVVHGVIYPPQVALVGFGAIIERAYAVDGMVGSHPLVTATLAGDHRASDGAQGARLLNLLDRRLQAPEDL